MNLFKKTGPEPVGVIPNPISVVEIRENICREIRPERTSN